MVLERLLRGLYPKPQEVGSYKKTLEDLKPRGPRAHFLQQGHSHFNKITPPSIVTPL